MNSVDDLSQAIARSRAIISLLGPGKESLPRDAFASYYRRSIPLMREHGVRRILALATTAIYRTEDLSSISRSLTAGLIKLVANSGFHNMLAVREYFDAVDDENIDWVVFRLGMLSGTCEASAWADDRDKGTVYAGPLGGRGFTSSINRSLLAKWLTGTALDESIPWVRQMPAISKSS